MDFARDQLETRVATLKLMLVTERARPKPDENKITTLENELTEAKSALSTTRTSIRDHLTRPITLCTR